MPFYYKMFQENELWEREKGGERYQYVNSTQTIWMLQRKSDAIDY